MPNGDEIKPGVTFIDIRSKYKDDPMYDTIRRAYEAGEDQKFTSTVIGHSVIMLLH